MADGGSSRRARNFDHADLSFSEWIIERAIHWGDDEVARDRRRCRRLPASLASGCAIEIDLAPERPYRTCGARLFMRVEATKIAARRWTIPRISARALVAAAAAAMVHAVFAAPWLPALNADHHDEPLDRYSMMHLSPIPFGECPSCWAHDYDEPEAQPIVRRKADVLCGDDGTLLDPPSWTPIGPTERGVLAGCTQVPFVHVVAAGETLTSIARRYAVDWRTLYAPEVNPWLVEERKPDRIFVGDRIVVPDPPGEITCLDVR